MPTTQPLDPGDDAEGQLKPIADFAKISQPAPRPSVPREPSPKPTPQPQPQVPDQVSASQSVHFISTPGGKQHRTTLKIPHLTLSGRVNNPDNNPTPRQKSTPHRSTPFTDKDVINAWNAYAQAHPTEHVLINAMRSINPVRRDDQNIFDVVMVNQIQVDTINACMIEVLTHMRDSLQNDDFNISVSVSDGPPSPDTWNDHEVLKYMLENKPDLAKFISTLSLNL